MKPPHLTSMERGTYRDDWGTPDWILDIHRAAFGQIDLDLASDEIANRRVQAVKYWKRGERIDPTRDLKLNKSNWCNPPGPWSTASLFWEAWLSRMMSHDANGTFLFFNADHLRHIAVPLSVYCYPGYCYLGIIRKRVRYVGAPSSCSFPSALVMCSYRQNLHLSGNDDNVLWSTL